MDIVIEFLKEINICQLVAMGMMFWFFYSRLDKKISDLDKRLSSKIEDIDRRLCRIEGSLSIQGHCLFNQTHK